MCERSLNTASAGRSPICCPSGRLRSVVPGGDVGGAELILSVGQFGDFFNGAQVSRF